LTATKDVRSVLHRRQTSSEIIYQRSKTTEGNAKKQENKLDPSVTRGSNLNCLILNADHVERNGPRQLGAQKEADI
jgi:hypothetical protein